eukprot:Gb_20429 [translate_table: standard]
MAGNLTANAIIALNNGDVDLRPVVQVLEIKQIATAQSKQERYRMVLSDGSHLQQAMLATQLNELVRAGQLQKGSVVQLTEYICNTVQNRKIIIVLNMEVVIVNCERIGEPKPLNDASVQQQQRPSMPMQSAPQVQPAESYGGSYNIGSRTGPNPNPVAQPLNGVFLTSESGMGPPGPPHMSGAGSFAKPTQAAAHPVQNSATVGVGAGATLGRGLNAPSNPYGRPPVASSYQPPPMYSNRGPIAKNEAPARIIPIAALNPYQGRWTIKARVTAKGDLRRFNNAKGDGKVFSFDLLDCDGGEIRVTCFNAVADQFYDRIESGRVYVISKGSLKPAQKNFNHLKNDWEIFLESSSIVEPCLEEDNSIPQQHFNFRPISEIENMENNSMVDIIGVVITINPSSTIMRKNGMETQKRTLQLRDMSGRSVELTMWGAFCNKEGQQLQEMCDSGGFPILAVKAGRISEFSGKSVGTITSSQLFINRDFPEAHRLRNWFEREGKNVASQSITKEGAPGGRVDMRKMVAQIKDEGLGRSDKPDWIAVKASLSFIKVDNFCYTACPLMIGERQCNKKVSNYGDGTWHCERCDRNFPECDYRYLLQAQIQDHTGLTWVTAFQEAGEEIMGVTAKDLYMLKHEEQDDIKFGEIIRKVLFNQYLFKLKVKEETYSDEQRVKCTVVKAERLDYSSESKILLDTIGKLSKGEFSTIAAATTTNMATNAGLYNAGYGNSVYGGSGSGNNPGMNYGSNTPGASQRGQNIGIGGGYLGNSGSYGGGPNGSSNMHSASASCYKCGREGHFANVCPSDMGGHSGPSFGGGYGNSGANMGGTSANCYRCGQGGHWARECPSLGRIPAANGGGGAASGSYGTSSGGYGGGY